MSRQWQLTRRMAPGTLGGRSRVATPTPRTLAPKGPGSELASGVINVTGQTRVETFTGASSTFGWDLNWEDTAAHLLNTGGVGGIKAGGSYFFESRRTGPGSVVYAWADNPGLWAPGVSPFAYYVELTVAAWPTPADINGPGDKFAEVDLWLGSDAGNVIYVDNGGTSQYVQHGVGVGPHVFTGGPLITVGSVVRLELRADGSIDYSIDGVSLVSAGAGTVTPDYSSGWSGAYFSNAYVGFQINPWSGGPSWADCEVAVDNVTLGPL